MAGVAAIESESKRRKHNGEEDLVDRFSNLPDALVTYILSFLPIKEAVKTCILSKRWKLSWTSVSKLEFIERDLMPTRLQKNRKKGAKWFKKLVDGVLRARDSSSIKVFKISVSVGISWDRTLIGSSCIRSWISKAIMHSVEELDLYFPGSQSIALPQPLYTCERLRVLRLEGPFNVNVPDVVCLKNLKTLCLAYAISFDDIDLNKILSTCELEELCLKRCWKVHGWMSCICSPSLKYLSLSDWLRGDVECSVVVDTPQLKYIDLSITYGLRKSYTLKRLPCLHEADIGIDSALNIDVLIKLFQSISNVEILAFSPLYRDVLDSDHYQKLPVFYNVKRLDIELGIDSLKHMPYLLERLPNLETLVLEFSNTYYEWHEPDNIAQCLCLSSHLKKVVIEAFKGSDIEMHAVEYLLKNGMVLDDITIYSSSAEYEERSRDDVFKKLLKFPRGSSTCQIDFLDY